MRSLGSWAVSRIQLSWGKRRDDLNSLQLLKWSGLLLRNLFATKPIVLANTTKNEAK